MCIFLNRGKIDKVQLILGRPGGGGLKLTKYQVPHLTTKCCAFQFIIPPLIQEILQF